MKKIILTMIALVFALMTFSEVYIFLYHRFDDERYPSTSTSTEEIKNHIKIVKKKRVWNIRSPGFFIICEWR